MCGCGVSAVNMDEGSSDIDETSAEISDDYTLQKMNDEDVEKLIEPGNNAGIKGGSSYLNVSLYTQMDSRWKDEPLGDSTMQYAGSEVTSFAMVMKYYKGASHTPLTVLQTMGNYPDGVDWNHAGEHYNVSCAVIEGKTSDEYISEIIGLINAARPAIIGLRGAEDTHFVVAYGYNQDTIYINDPAGRYSTLQEYFNDDKGYYVYEVINCYPNE
ncbi:MAG: C39 family peptidase [Lachnospiraceae bacterium]